MSNDILIFKQDTLFIATRTDPNSKHYTGTTEIDALSNLLWDEKFSEYQERMASIGLNVGAEYSSSINDGKGE